MTMPQWRSRLILGATLFSTPGLNSGVHILAVLGLLVVLVVVLVPLTLHRGGSKPGPSDSDGGDGWGKGPQPPRTPPEGPRGGIPLDDARPAHARLRGNGRLADQLPTRLRRSIREPDRKPVRESTPG
jgi:hypothetical protein